MKLSRIGELSLLKEIRSRFATKARDVLVGIGDDAAVLRPRNEYLLVSTDMMVEGVHFDLRFVTAYQLGVKLISVNVSDIYAMGGRPSVVLLGIAMAGNSTKEWFDAFLDGIKAAVKKYGIALIGGDVSSCEGTIVVSATVIGHAGRYTKRAGAKVGDRIYVTGSLGDSACGLEILKKIGGPVPLAEGERGEIRKGKGRTVVPYAFRSKLSGTGLSWRICEPLLRRHLMPLAKNPVKVSRFATSMLDISDGLLIDLSRLCDESGTGARIFEENIPLSAELRKAAPILGLDPMKLALTGGEDYELLFSAPAGRRIGANYIGDVIESERTLVDRNGKERHFRAVGYEHFSGKRVRP